MLPRLLAYATSVLAVTVTAAAQPPSGPTLPGTEPLTFEGDLASEMVAEIDRFLLAALERAIDQRPAHWDRDFASADDYAASVETNRRRLAHILGIRDERAAPRPLELIATTARPAPIARGEGYEALVVRWRAFGDVFGEGLLLRPTGNSPVANLVVIPHPDHSPEMLAALAEGLAAEMQLARRLAERGCRVLVPVIVDREPVEHPMLRIPRLSRREYLYRAAFVLGRHLIGYEVQKVLAGIDALEQEPEGAELPVGVAGWGDGGMLALYSAALDPRIDAALVSGYFDCRHALWEEPLDRNVFGLLERFGDAELAAMIAPRALVVEAAAGPEMVIPPGTGGGPGRLVTPAPEVVRREVARAARLVEDLGVADWLQLIESDGGGGTAGSDAALDGFLAALLPDVPPPGTGSPSGGPRRLHAADDPDERMERQVHQIVRHNEWLIGESESQRRAFLADVEYDSLEAYTESIAPYREHFYDEVIGRFDLPLSPPDPRSRLLYDEPAFSGYEVVLDVFENVFAYGVLLVPRDIGEGERRPLVVCQHGLEGRPQELVTGDHGAYGDYAARLAERGFVVFAPQNLYLFGDRFRTLQRKANPLGKTLFSIIVPQHQQIVDWLGSLDFVDDERIAFYGLSYGGKTAMRVPPLVDGYMAVICSADFNEWVWKNATTRSPYSYVWTGEYEIFEFDLGGTFNYAEMAALIAPRPFMVERGHFDGVAPDEQVAYEFAKVRFLYAARLGIGERCRIEWFVGPHTIHGRGTFDFLHEVLDWPAPVGR